MTIVQLFGLERREVVEVFVGSEGVEESTHSNVATST